MKKANYLNRRFGMYVVVKELVESTGTNKGGLWLCKCDCGNEFECLGHKTHNRESCGCLLALASKKRGLNSRRPESVTIGMEYLVYKNNAQQRDFIPLPKSEWFKIVKEPCYYCGQTDVRNRATMKSYLRDRGITMTPEIQKTYEVAINGIDRKDSEKGYEKGNMVACCGVCNRMKNNFPVSLFLEKVKLIYGKHHIINMSNIYNRRKVH